MKLLKISYIDSIAYRKSIDVTATIVITLQNQLWVLGQCIVERMIVKSKFRGFVSSELVGVPNTRKIR